MASVAKAAEVVMVERGEQVGTVETDTWEIPTTCSPVTEVTAASEAMAAAEAMVAMPEWAATEVSAATVAEVGAYSTWVVC